MEPLALVPSGRPRSDNVLHDRLMVTRDVSNQHTARFQRIRTTSLAQHVAEGKRIYPKLAHIRVPQLKQSCLAART